MAKKRMFRLDVLETDAFMDMPLTTQALYFHLNLRADDDGFVGNPKRIARVIGASLDDLNLLIAKRFVLTFEDGVIVIKHWRLHNNLTSNRYQETKFIEDKSFLKIKDNGAYSFDHGEPIDDAHYIEVGKRETKQRRNKDETKTSLDKNSIEKDSIEKDSIDKYISPLISPLMGETTPPKKETQRQLFDRLKSEYSISDSLLETIGEFLDYKTEIKKPYKETGMKQLLKRFEKEEQTHGTTKVIEVVNNTMANNYQGIVWDWLIDKKNDQVDLFEKWGKFV